MSAADLTTVIVNWNTVDLLDDALASVVAEVPADWEHEIVVVDNASTDGSVAWLAEHWPQVRVIANEDNVGFCRANNQALKECTSTFALLINTDARLTPGCLAGMVARFEADDRAAVVGPRLVYGDGTLQRWTAGSPFTLRSMANYLLFLDRLATRHRWFSGIYLGSDVREPFQPGWVSSAVMMLRTSALDSIGLMDDRIFVYMDDVDLCTRAIDAGWHVWYAADVTAVHFMGASTKRTTGKASPEALRALNRWFVRRHGHRAGWALRGLEAVGFGLRAALYGALGTLRRNPSATAQASAHFVHLKLSLEPIDV